MQTYQNNHPPAKPQKQYVGPFEMLINPDQNRLIKNPYGKCDTDDGSSRTDGRPSSRKSVLT